MKNGKEDVLAKKLSTIEITVDAISYTCTKKKSYIKLSTNNTSSQYIINIPNLPSLIFHAQMLYSRRNSTEYAVNF